MPFTDEWLLATLEPLLPAETMAGLQKEAESGRVSLWEAVVQRRALTDKAILEAVGARFRLPLADLQASEPDARATVPESLARRHQVLPLRMSESWLEVATANPFDINAEKDLAFATGRDVRMLLVMQPQ